MTIDEAEEIAQILEQQYQDLLFNTSRDDRHWLEIDFGESFFLDKIHDYSDEDQIKIMKQLGF